MEWQGLGGTALAQEEPLRNVILKEDKDSDIQARIQAAFDKGFAKGFAKCQASSAGVVKAVGMFKGPGIWRIENVDTNPEEVHASISWSPLPPALGKAGWGSVGRPVFPDDFEKFTQIHDVMYDANGKMRTSEHGNLRTCRITAALITADQVHTPMYLSKPTYDTVTDARFNNPDKNVMLSRDREGLLKCDEPGHGFTMCSDFSAVRRFQPVQHSYERNWRHSITGKSAKTRTGHHPTYPMYKSYSQEFLIKPVAGHAAQQFQPSYVQILSTPTKVLSRMLPPFYGSGGCVQAGQQFGNSRFLVDTDNGDPQTCLGFEENGKLSWDTRTDGQNSVGKGNCSDANHEIVLDPVQWGSSDTYWGNVNLVYGKLPAEKCVKFCPYVHNQTKQWNKTKEYCRNSNWRQRTAYRSKDVNGVIFKLKRSKPKIDPTTGRKTRSAKGPQVYFDPSNWFAQEAPLLQECESRPDGSNPPNCVETAGKDSTWLNMQSLSYMQTVEHYGYFRKDYQHTFYFSCLKDHGSRRPIYYKETSGSSSKIASLASHAGVANVSSGLPVGTSFSVSLSGVKGGRLVFTKVLPCQEGLGRARKNAGLVEG